MRDLPRRLPTQEPGSYWLVLRYFVPPMRPLGEESALSNRLLVFTSNHVYMQCNRMHSNISHFNNGIKFGFPLVENFHKVSWSRGRLSITMGRIVSVDHLRTDVFRDKHDILEENNNSEDKEGNKKHHDEEHKDEEDQDGTACSDVESESEQHLQDEYHESWGRKRSPVYDIPSLVFQWYLTIRSEQMLTNFMNI